MPLSSKQQRSNEEWVGALRGDQGPESQRQAYEELGELLYGQVFAYLRKTQEQQRFSRSNSRYELEETANELVQITLMHIHEKRLYDQYSGKNGAQFTTFITGIALRKAIDLIRKDWRYELVSFDKNESSETQQTRSLPELIDFNSPNPETSQVLREFWMDFRDCIEVLDTNRKMVFLWREQEGISFDDIGGRLGKSKNAVFQLLFHAKTKLRECLTSKQWNMDDISSAMGRSS